MQETHKRRHQERACEHDDGTGGRGQLCDNSRLQTVKNHLRESLKKRSNIWAELVAGMKTGVHLDKEGNS